jgi:signal recognition particle receptor subunit beta
VDDCAHNGGFRSSLGSGGALPLACQGECQGGPVSHFRRTAPAVMGRAARVSPSCGEVLLLGLQGAGKTLLCRHFELTSARRPSTELKVKTQQSIGIELVHLAMRRRAFTIREIGGAMQPVWNRYFAGADTVLFMIDGASTETASGAIAVLLELLTQIPEKKFLLFINKCDAPEAPSETTRSSTFRLPELEAAAGAGRLCVLAGSALTGDGVAAALDWCMDSLLEREDETIGVAERTGPDPEEVQSGWSWSCLPPRRGSGRSKRAIAPE